MHPPCAQQRADMGVFEGFLQPCTGRGKQEAGEIQRSRHALGAQCFEHEICKCTDFHVRPEQAEEMRRLGPESRDERFPRRGIAGREGAEGGQCFGHVGGDARPCAIGEGRGEGAVDRHEFAAVFRQFRAICLEKRASGKEGQVHRGPVVTEAGQGVFACLDRAARHGGLFEDPHAPALGRQVQRRGQRVVACPDQDCVELRGHDPPPRLTQGYLQTHLNMSSMIPDDRKTTGTGYCRMVRPTGRRR